MTIATTAGDTCRSEITEEILNGVGRQTRKDYQRGVIDALVVMKRYKHNLREADAVHTYGLTRYDLLRFLKETRNPILRVRLQEALSRYDELQKKSGMQDRQSRALLQESLQNALGVGLKRVIAIMKRECRRHRDFDMIVVTTLLEAEYANLSAKHKCRNSRKAYARKSWLLDRLSWMLKDSEWRYGYCEADGKNASYVLYFYLPDGVQLSWHTKDFTAYERFPYLDVTWDGQVCSTLRKILSYISARYAPLFPNAAESAPGQ